MYSSGQKAPSAKRCIKTQSARNRAHPTGCVRKHRAPNGALRQFEAHSWAFEYRVRKHRAPKGALRLDRLSLGSCSLCDGQKAPSAKRCIKTYDYHQTSSVRSRQVRKHRAPKCALRRGKRCTRREIDTRSESTERQTVH